MSRTRLPYWVSSAPPYVGSTRAGKLSADQWRSFCTIHLVVSLVRLWGASDPQSRHHKMLTNFMDLVTAVRLATMRSMTPDRIVQYQFHMTRYLTELLELYPDVGLSPNQHSSLHYPELLERFGPTHAWRCWAIERMNFKLQEIPTNMKFGAYSCSLKYTVALQFFVIGEMEQTMYERFCMAQQLRVLVSEKQLPETLHSFVDIFRRTFHSEDRLNGTLLNDTQAFVQKFGTIPVVADSPQERLPPITRQLLQTWLSDHSIPSSKNFTSAHMHTTLIKHGVMYKTYADSPSYSYLSYHHTTVDWAVGRIKSIFTFSSKVFVLLEKYEDLSLTDLQYDYYRAFPTSGGHIIYDTVETTPVLISSDEIIAHCVLTSSISERISRPHLWALPMDRVRALKIWIE